MNNSTNSSGTFCTRPASPRFLWLITMALTLSLPVKAQVEVLDQVVAIVDDDIILASELQERVAGVRSNMEARGVEMPSDDVLIRETLD